MMTYEDVAREQSAPAASVEVSGDVIRAYHEASWDAEGGLPTADQIEAGLRAAFAAAGVVPLAELERCKKVRVAWREAITEALELPAGADLLACTGEVTRLRSDLAAMTAERDAANARAKAAEKERDYNLAVSCDISEGEAAAAIRDALKGGAR